MSEMRVDWGGVRTLDGVGLDPGLVEAVVSAGGRAQGREDLMILDGCCGMRELIAWVQSYMVGHDLEKSARFTVLSAVSSDAENRKAIYDTCFAPQLVSLLAG